MNSHNSNPSNNEAPNPFGIGLNGRKPSSSHSKNHERFGDIVNEIYCLIHADQEYFNGVFIFFASIITPIINDDHRMQKISYNSLKSYIKSLDIDEAEVEKQIEIFESVLKLNDDEYSAFRGFFLEEFLTRKLEENCGAFERLSCEEIIEPLNYEKFSGFTSDADMDIMKFESSSQVSNPTVLKNVVKFDGYECKANVVTYVKQIYNKKPKNSKMSKVIYMTEVESLISELYPDSINTLHFVGYESLSSEELNCITKEINRIRHKKRYSLDFQTSLIRIKDLFAKKRFVMMGREEINDLFYA